MGNRSGNRCNTKHEKGMKREGTEKRGGEESRLEGKGRKRAKW